MATNDTVRDMQPPDGDPKTRSQNCEQCSNRVVEMSEHEKDVLIEQLKRQLSAVASANEQFSALLDVQKDKIMQLQEATKEFEELDETSAPDEKLTEELQPKEAQLKEATQKQCDELRAKVSQLKAAVADSEQGKLLAEELQQKVELLEDAAAKFEDDKLTMRLLERHEVVMTYTRLLDSEVSVTNQNAVALLERACAMRFADLQRRADWKAAQNALTAEGLRHADGVVHDLLRAFDKGMKYIIAADREKADGIELQYTTQAHEMLCNKYYRTLLSRVTVFSQTRAGGCVEIQDTQGHEWSHDIVKSFSAEELRLITASAKRARGERIATTTRVIQSLDDLWYVEIGAMSRTRLSEGDTDKPEHVGQIGFRIGKVIQNSVLWHHGFGIFEPGAAMLPGDWKQKDLLPPGRNLDNLPPELVQFWEGVSAGAEQSRRDYGLSIEDVSMGIDGHLVYRYSF